MAIKCVCGDSQCNKSVWVEHSPDHFNEARLFVTGNAGDQILIYLDRASATELARDLVGPAEPSEPKPGPVVNPSTIDCAYQTAMTTRKLYAQAAALVLAAKDALRINEAHASQDEAFQALKNETARELYLRKVCEVARLNLGEAERHEVLLRGDWEAAELDIKRIDDLMRLMLIEMGKLIGA